MNAASYPELPRLNAPVHTLTAQWVLPMDAPPIAVGYVQLDTTGRIIRLGAQDATDAPDNLPPTQPGSLLTPGLINTHSHLEQSFPQSLPRNPKEDFVDWLIQVVSYNRAHGSPTERVARMQSGIQECLANGTTCVNDLIADIDTLPPLIASGLRGIVSLECFHPQSKPIQIAHITQRFQEIEQACHGNQRLLTGLSPHAPYTMSPPAWQALLDACQPARIHTHVAESIAETAFLQGRDLALNRLFQRVLGQDITPPSPPASSPVALLRQHGLLNAQTIVAHVIHTSAEDRAHLLDSGCSIAHCPRSNLALHGSTLRASDFSPLIPMGLGTDGRLSTENLDLRAEARAAMQYHPSWRAEQALTALTQDGARVLGLAHQVGSLTPGKAGDMVLWQAASAELPSDASPADWVLHPDTRPRCVMIQGEVKWLSPM